MMNQNDAEFFETIKNSLTQECQIFNSMLDSSDLLEVITGVKFTHALIKHKAIFLLNEKSFGCLDLCFKFPWANILHNVVVNGMTKSCFEHLILFLIISDYLCIPI